MINSIFYFNKLTSSKSAAWGRPSSRP